MEVGRGRRQRGQFLVERKPLAREGKRGREDGPGVLTGKDLFAEECFEAVVEVDFGAMRFGVWDWEGQRLEGVERC